MISPSYGSQGQVGSACFSAWDLKSQRVCWAWALIPRIWGRFTSKLIQVFSRIAHGGLGTEVSFFPGRLCSQLLEATRVPSHTRLFLCLLSHSVVSYSLQPHGLYPAGLFCPLNFPGKNTGVDCHFLLQGNLPDPGVKPLSPTSPVSTGRLFTTVPPGKWKFQFSSAIQSCPTLCNPMNRSRPGLPVHHQLPEFTQTHVHRVGDAIQPSHPLSSPSPPAPNPSQHQGLFQWVNSTWGGQRIGVLASASVLPMNIQDWSPLELTGWISLQSKGLSRVFFNTTVQKHQFFGISFLHSPTLPSMHEHWKNHSLD